MAQNCSVRAALEPLDARLQIGNDILQRPVRFFDGLQTPIKLCV